MNGRGYNDPDGPCTHCGLRPDGPDIPLGGKPDPCLGVLPNVAHACCGHGKRSVQRGPYVVIAPGYAPGTDCMTIPRHAKRSLYGWRALEYFRQHGVGPDALRSDNATEEAA